jgi:osmotically inducible lipoprotein OsmB
MLHPSFDDQPTVTASTTRFAKLAIALPLLGAALLLGACGNTALDRGVSGAGIGAGTGAAIGAIFGGVGVVPGALIGAAVGGGTGALSSKQQIDIGDPVWRQ